MKANTLILAITLVPTALAQTPEPPATAPPFVVSGTRLADEGSQTLTRTTVIDREQIEAFRPFSLVEVLRHAAGVHVIEQGGRGGFSSVLLRGGEPNFTAVFIDGVQVNDPTNSRGGSFDFSTLSAEDIERIEVIRGAQSAVYGSDALAGVINIVTRRNVDRTRLDADIAAGSDGYRRGSATLAVPFGDHGVRATAYVEDDGDPVEGSAYDATGGRLSAQFALSESTSLVADVSVLSADAESYPEDSGGPRLAVIRDVETRDIDERQYHMGLRKSFANGVGVTFSASRYSRDELADAPGIAPGVIDGVPPISSDTSFERDTLSVVARLDRPGPVQGALGAEYRSETGDATGTIDFGFLIPTDYGIDRDIMSVFAEASFEPHAQWLFNVGLRYDDPDGFSSETTPRVGARYRIRESGITLYANWSEAYKLPSFYALALPIIANPDLLPEESRSASAGLEFESQDGGFKLNAEAFRNSFRNLVDFEPALFTNVNRGKVVTKGVELTQSYTTRSSNVTLSSHFTYLEADIIGSDQRLRGRPHVRAGVGIDWQVRPDVSVRGDAWYTDSVFESSVPTGFVELDSFVRADLALNWRVDARWTVYGGVQNLLDEDYEQAVGFPSPGRRLQVGVGFSR